MWKFSLQSFTAINKTKSFYAQIVNDQKLQIDSKLV